MAERTCIEDGCERPVGSKGARGRCPKHYKALLATYERAGQRPPSPREERIAQRGGLVADQRRPARAPRYCIDCGREVEYSGSRGRCGSCAYRWRQSYKKRGLPVPKRDQNIDARYPPRQELLAMMAEVGSLNRLAEAVGVNRGSLQTYLQRRPELREELYALRKPMRGTPHNPNSGKPWSSRALAPNRTRYPSGYYVLDPLAVEYCDVLRGDPCSYCGQPTTTIDHIEPLGHGGTDLWENLTGACHRCNSSKGDRHLLAFMLDTVDQRALRMPKPLPSFLSFGPVADTEPFVPQASQPLLVIPSPVQLQFDLDSLMAG